MKFKNILTEAMIDTLEISKLDRGILKTIHKFINEKGVYINSRDGTKNEWDLSGGEKLLKVSNALGYNDYDHLYKLYKYYLKYGGVLFGESPSIDIETTIDIIKDYELLRPILLKYMYDNYVGKIYNVGDIEWVVDTPLGDLSEAMTEHASAIELFTNTDGSYVVGYCSFIPSKSMFDSGGLGYDIISMDEGLSEYNGTYLKKNTHLFEEILKTGILKDIKYPINLKEETLKKYFDDLFNKFVDGPITSSTEIILDYMDHVNVHQPPQ